MGLKKDSKSAQLSSVVFLTRRLLLVIIALTLQDYPVEQILSVLLTCTLNLIFLLHKQIDEERSAYRTEVVNDLTIYLAASFTLAILGATGDPVSQESIGFALIAVVCFFLLFNTAAILRRGLTNLRLSLARLSKKFMRNVKAWDPEYVKVCQCRCATCGPK